MILSFLILFMKSILFYEIYTFDCTELINRIN